MNAVGIDVSKGKSTVCVFRPHEEIVVSPYVVTHSNEDLSKLADLLKSIQGETKVVMECTGSYYIPIADFLHKAGFFVSCVHSLLIHNYDNNSIRKVKTDKADSIKIAHYALSNWLNLKPYSPEDDVRKELKAYNRQYNKYIKIKTMLKNNLISLIDQSFPEANNFFTSSVRADGHEKWIDFVHTFWHADCVSKLSYSAFCQRYSKWCKRSHYHYSDDSANNIYSSAKACVTTMSKNNINRLLVKHAAEQLTTISISAATLIAKMNDIAKTLPEYPVVHAFRGVGDTLAPQLIAEIGDITRIKSKSSLVCFAGLEPPPNESGKFSAKSTPVSKKGSPYLRKTLFQVMNCLLSLSPTDDPVYQFLDRKRAEGKDYRCYMTAGSAKFLRIYYARVTDYLKNNHAA